MTEANHRFNPFFLQGAFEFLECLVVGVERIVPDRGIILLIDDFENPIVPSGTVDLYSDRFAISGH